MPRRSKSPASTPETATPAKTETGPVYTCGFDHVYRLDAAVGDPCQCGKHAWGIGRVRKPLPVEVSEDERDLVNLIDNQIEDEIYTQQPTKPSPADIARAARARR